MKVLRKIIEIDEELCDGCGQCIPACAEGALELVNGKARVVEDRYCDGLGACLGDCPTGALRIIEREVEEFDEAAVEAFLREKDAGDSEGEPDKPCGCPSANIEVFVPNSPPAAHLTDSDSPSALGHWPVQIRLIPPTAPFLKNADLLVLADCCAVAYAGLHRDLVKDRVVMMGCPKFDDTGLYEDRFAEIFRTAGIKSITAVFMEVPCCSGLPGIIRKGMQKAGTDIPLTEMVVTRKGSIA
ncbi:4Fe-4S ferredoxin [Desulfonema ishimotonii]|uniref:4Fe-4S ferredoxin n=1 Tax=Desulfonema ishimotonii TaxID=45657 RepID=A0A401FVG1_9BACT|nr:4Fe-4S binding protein [Desulfonema ishimotonii]GBC60950.1 4Fe-4S ferredoxin [Desulfonema ishimotonii]